jgi:hypothetical protein
MVRSWSTWHPHGWVVPSGARLGGGAVTMTGLYGGSPGAGPVGPVPGSGGLSFNGMDPSDPTSYVRPYNPQPGMIALLNYDGAVPNKTQTV